MSNIEHLIENAIDTFKSTDSYAEARSKFKSEWVNIEMSKQEKIELDVILEIANYVFCKYIETEENW